MALEPKRFEFVPIPWLKSEDPAKFGTWLGVLTFALVSAVFENKPPPPVFGLLSVEFSPLKILGFDAPTEGPPPPVPKRELVPENNPEAPCAVGGVAFKLEENNDVFPVPSGWDCCIVRPNRPHGKTLFFPKQNSSPLYTMYMRILICI